MFRDKNDIEYDRDEKVTSSRVAGYLDGRMINGIDK